MEKFTVLESVVRKPRNSETSSICFPNSSRQNACHDFNIFLIIEWEIVYEISSALIKFRHIFSGLNQGENSLDNGLSIDICQIHWIKLLTNDVVNEFRKIIESNLNRLRNYSKIVEDLSVPSEREIKILQNKK